LSWKCDSEKLLFWGKKTTLFCVQFVTFFIRYIDNFF